MVRILEFRRPDASQSPATANRGAEKRPDGESAEIIIFPGVRIERKERGGSGLRAKRRAKRAKGPSGRDR